VTEWIPVWVALIPTVLAGLFAYRTKRSEIRAQSRIEAERRIAVSRGETFEPLIERIGEMLDKISRGEDVSQAWTDEEFTPTLLKFLRWVQIYGSDEAVWSAHRLMQGINNKPPSNVLPLLLADIILAARRDLANPETRVTLLDVLGLRITDIYEHPWAAQSLEELCRSENWVPPWGMRFKHGKPLRWRD
jgi:hypothetical protein